MNLSNTAQRAIDAYGGEALWRKHKFIEAEVSAKGLAFTLKRRPFFDHAKLKMEIDRPFSKLSPIGADKNISGVLDSGTVRLENGNGNTISERKEARNFFPLGKRLFYWDDLDMAYFANYAFWNYFTLPNLLMNNQINWIEKKDGILLAEFPEHIPTHSKQQEFVFDKQTGLLIQHNYTADIISKLATAANVVKAHSKSHNILCASHRIVTPRNKKGEALKWPVLIEIIVHSIKFTE